MKQQLLCVLAFCALAVTAKADCDPGTHFEPDGGLVCTWYRDFVTGALNFTCGQTGECVSDCYPYECAELAAVQLTNSTPASRRAPRADAPFPGTTTTSCDCYSGWDYIACQFGFRDPCGGGSSSGYGLKATPILQFSPIRKTSAAPAGRL